MLVLDKIDIPGDNIRIAVDVGGTFTDVALIAPDGVVATYKLLSTPADYAEAVIDGGNALMQR